MRISCGLALDDKALPEAALRIARVSERARMLEAAGVDACFVTDHPAPSAKWLAGGGHRALDPFVALSVAAAATETLRLHSNILVLPYRNPFLIAHAAASLDALSGGRLIMGVAAGYLRAEFEALGAPFNRRGALCDEAIPAIRAAWEGEPVTRTGERFDARGVVIRPRPAQAGGPPIWVGGNSRAAMERAVRLGDGWAPFPAPAGGPGNTDAIASPDDLAAKLGQMRDYAAEIGRETPPTVCFVPFGMAMHAEGLPGTGAFLDQIGALEALGVEWIAVSPPGGDDARFAATVAWLGEEIVPALRR